MMLEVKYSENTAGVPYVEKEIEGWPVAAVKKILATLKSLQDSGLAPLLRSRRIKKLEGYKNLYEIREKHQGMCYRVFGTLIGRFFWLLHAVEKKKQKLPPHEIKTAERRAKLILNNHS